MGDFHMNSMKYKYLFADRWADGIGIEFFNDEGSIEAMLARITLHEHHKLTDYMVASWYPSWTPATEMYEFILQELPRKTDMRGFRRKEDLREKPELTNCVAFTCRGGSVLAVDGQHFLATSSAMMAQVCDHRL
ncbi:unnamed protein product [Symbiodinium natans]|uniref:Uncharacterized protein n=1 Tax=Symbiodinium natans TaxID=878477 RepID=A0A812KDB6_9DINO|nr:unnamed protein product [Symbiodinium natans]